MICFVSKLVVFYSLYSIVLSTVTIEHNIDGFASGVSAFSSGDRRVSLLRPGNLLKPRTITVSKKESTFENILGDKEYPDSKSFLTTTVLGSKISRRRDSGDSESQDMSSTDVTGPFALLLTSQFLLFIGVGAVIPSIPLYGKEIGLSGAANGIVISAPAVALFLAANWSGRRADMARKPAMMIGMAVIAVSDIGTALAQGIYTLVLARLGLGAGRALSEAGERGMLVDLANRIPEMRGRALAAQQAVVAFGIAIGAPAGGLVVERYGPRAAFFCVSVAAIFALVLYAFLPETVVRTSSAMASRDLEEVEQVMDENTSGIRVWSELLKQNEWRGLALCQSGASFGFAAKIASIPILAASTLPGGAVGAGALLSAAGLSGLVGAPLGGYITDRIGSKGAAVISGIVSGIGLILIPAALMMSESSSSYPELEVSISGVLLQRKALLFSSAVLIWSLGVSAQGPALTALAQEKSLIGVEATSLSLVKAAGDGTYILAPFILGLVADALTEYPGSECALAGSMTLIGTGALYVLVQQASTTKRE